MIESWFNNYLKMGSIPIGFNKNHSQAYIKDPDIYKTKESKIHTYPKKKPHSSTKGFSKTPHLPARLLKFYLLITKFIAPLQRMIPMLQGAKVQWLPLDLPYLHTSTFPM